MIDRASEGRATSGRGTLPSSSSLFSSVTSLFVLRSAAVEAPVLIAAVTESVSTPPIADAGLGKKPTVYPPAIPVLRSLAVCAILSAKTRTAHSTPSTLSPSSSPLLNPPNHNNNTKMLCFEELNCASSDVFSYMCSLAMEKCSKKSEKKRAACGGAAMRKRLLIKNFVAHMLSQETEIRKKIESQQQQAVDERELEHIEDVYDVEKDDEDDVDEYDDQEEEEEEDEEEEDSEEHGPMLGYEAEEEDSNLSPQYNDYEGCASSDLYSSSEASLMDAVPVEELMKAEQDIFEIHATCGDENIIEIECSNWPDFQTVPNNQHFLIPCDSRELIFPHHHYESYLTSSCSEYEFALPDNILEDEPPMSVPSNDSKAPSTTPLFTNLVNIVSFPLSDRLSDLNALQTPQPCVVVEGGVKEGGEISLYSFDDNPRKRGRGLLEQDENTMYTLIVPSKRVKLL